MKKGGVVKMSLNRLFPTTFVLNRRGANNGLANTFQEKGSSLHFHTLGKNPFKNAAEFCDFRHLGRVRHFILEPGIKFQTSPAGYVYPHRRWIG